MCLYESMCVFLCVSVHASLFCVCVFTWAMSPAPQQGCSMSGSVPLFAGGQEPLTPQRQAFSVTPVYMGSKWGLRGCPALVLMLPAAFSSPGLKCEDAGRR